MLHKGHPRGCHGSSDEGSTGKREMYHVNRAKCKNVVMKCDSIKMKQLLELQKQMYKVKSVYMNM